MAATPSSITNTTTKTNNAIETIPVTSPAIANPFGGLFIVIAAKIIASNAHTNCNGTIINPKILIGLQQVTKLSIPSTSEAIDKAKAGTLYTAGQIINGKIDGVILKDETPAALKEYKLDDIKERAIVLVVMGDGENAKVYYAGELNAPAAQKGFLDFLKSGCKK